MPRTSNFENCVPNVHYVHEKRAGRYLEVRLSGRAQRDISNLQAAERTTVLARIEGLAGNPRPLGCKKLKGRLGTYWRIRAGDFRILYEISHDTVTVLVMRVVNRKEAYRNT